MAHPPPRIHGSAGSAAAYAATAPTYASGDASSLRSHWSISIPLETGWTWASWNPGTSIRPPRSITSVDVPMRSATVASVPTATMRPSRTPTACAHVRAASTV